MTCVSFTNWLGDNTAKYKTRGISAFIVASCVQNMLSIMTTTTYTKQR